MKPIVIFFVLLFSPLVAFAGPVGSYNQEGVYVFPYGTAIPPTVACAPNKVCEIELQPGEQIFDIVAGDTVHWSIGQGVSGIDRGAPNHGSTTSVIFFEPLDLCNRDAMGACASRLTTNLIITTDKRQYEVRLLADNNVGRTRYGFTYPRDATINAEPFRYGTEQTPPPTPDTGCAATNCFAAVSSGTGCLETARDYRIDVTGKPDYVPLIVCNDGIRTYLSMPLHYTAPSIYVVLDNGQQQLVDPHFSNGVYAIEGLPNHIIFIGDVGRRVPHVDIWKTH